MVSTITINKLEENLGAFKTSLDAMGLKNEKDYSLFPTEKGFVLVAKSYPHLSSDKRLDFRFCAVNFAENTNYTINERDNRGNKCFYFDAKKFIF